jgi:hypothetical protein
VGDVIVNRLSGVMGAEVRGVDLSRAGAERRVIHRTVVL